MSGFPFFSSDFRGLVGITNPWFFWWFSRPFQKKTKERKDSLHHAIITKISGISEPMVCETLRAGRLSRKDGKREND